MTAYHLTDNVLDDARALLAGHAGEAARLGHECRCCNCGVARAVIALRDRERDHVATEDTLRAGLAACTSELEKAIAEASALRARVAELEGLLGEAHSWISRAKQDAAAGRLLDRIDVAMGGKP